MNLDALLSELNRRGVRLTVDGQRLRWKAAQGGMTPALVDVLREHKAELLALSPQCVNCDLAADCPDRERIAADLAGVGPGNQP